MATKVDEVTLKMVRNYDTTSGASAGRNKTAETMILKSREKMAVAAIQKMTGRREEMRVPTKLCLHSSLNKALCLHENHY